MWPVVCVLQLALQYPCMPILPCEHLAGVQ